MHRPPSQEGGFFDSFRHACGVLSQYGADYVALSQALRLVRAFNQVMQQLEVSFARQRQFVSDASHELRTPIAVLQGHIQMLDRWGKSDPEVLDESLGVLKREIAELKDMVHRLLLLDRRAERGGKIYPDGVFYAQRE